jgi:hypothetical protein
MKAEMDESGVITIKAESGLEAYALDKWSQSSIIFGKHLQYAENSLIRGSRLIIDTMHFYED